MPDSSTRDKDHQHQQHGHHVFGYALDAALHAVIDDQRRDRHEQQREYHRRNRRRDERYEIAVLRRGFGLTRDVNQRVFRHPAADDRVIGHDEHRHEEGQYAQKLPLRIDFGISANGALLRAPPDGDVRCEQRKAECQHQRQIDDQKQPAAVLGRQIGKAPQIANAHGASGRRHHKAQLTGKVARLFLHVSILPEKYCSLSYHRAPFS